MSNTKAQAAKDKGNVAFKAADYPTAIGHYTDAVLADRKDPTYPLNRAAAYLKLGKFADAERDCNTVLNLSTNNVKALFRRGQARFGLGQLENAKNDFSDILKREPSNMAAQEELKKINDQLQRQKMTKSSISPANAILNPKGAPKRRVPIRILDANGHPWTPPDNSKPAVNTSTAIPPSVSQPQPQPKSTPLDTPAPKKPESSPSTLEAVSTRSIKKESSSSQSTKSPTAPLEPKFTPAAPSSTPSKPATFQDAKQARETKTTTRVGGGIFRKSGENTIIETRNQPVPPRDSNSSMATKVPSPPKREPPAEFTNFAASLNDGDSSVKPPKTLVDFARSWNSSSLEGKWRLINTIPPTNFPDLCSSSLESPLLVDILRVFSTVLKSPTAGDNVKAAIMTYLVNFTRIKRFHTLLLFFIPSEKALAREVWELLGKRPEGLWASVV